VPAVNNSAALTVCNNNNARKEDCSVPSGSTNYCSPSHRNRDAQAVVGATKHNSIWSINCNTWAVSLLPSTNNRLSSDRLPIEHDEFMAQHFSRWLMGVSEQTRVQVLPSHLVSMCAFAPASIWQSMQMPNANEFIQHTTSKVINTPSADFMQR